MLKKGCVLLNVSRGGLIDSDEVMLGLESGQIGALGLDVWENEGEAPRLSRFGCVRQD